MSKRYILKKEYKTITHNYNIGTEVAFVGGKYWIGFESFTEEQMNNLKDWVESIKEEPKEVFTWDDENVISYHKFYMGSENLTCHEAMIEFKKLQSHQLLKPDSKERIDKQDNDYWFQEWRELTETHQIDMMKAFESGRAIIEVSLDKRHLFKIVQKYSTFNDYLNTLKEK